MWVWIHRGTLSSVLGETILCIINCLSLISEHDRTLSGGCEWISITFQQTLNGTRKTDKAAEVGTAGQGIQGIHPGCCQCPNWLIYGSRVAKKQWFWLVLWVMYVPGGSHTTYLKVKIFMTCSDLGLNFLPLTWYLTSSLVFLLKSLWVSIFLSVNQYNNTNLPELFFCFVYFLYIVRDDICKSLENYLTPY